MQNPNDPLMSVIFLIVGMLVFFSACGKSCNRQEAACERITQTDCFSRSSSSRLLLFC